MTISVIMAFCLPDAMIGSLQRHGMLSTERLKDPGRFLSLSLTWATFLCLSPLLRENTVIMPDEYHMTWQESQEKVGKRTSLHEIRIYKTQHYIEKHHSVKCFQGILSDP